MPLQRVDVKGSSLLLVGAGGIGCEALKNLVSLGFQSIHVVDMDTIEVTNLNRQFLFRKRHIGLPKATVAAEALSCSGGAKVFGHVGDISDRQKFPHSFFRQFSIAVSALDNVEARRALNELALTVGFPVVETGSAGYLGQCSVVVPGVTECFDCEERAAPTVYPVCTIRNKPTAIVHCLVWAKEFLLNALFTPGAEDSRLFQLQAAHSVLEEVFVAEVGRLLAAPDLWSSSDRLPIPLEIGSDLPPWSYSPSEATLSHEILPLNRCIFLFSRAFEALRSRSRPIFFDKDDDDCLVFVVAAANLRAAVYGISPISLFEGKAKAGNIIPAVATTNAIIAGVASLLAVRLAAGEPVSNLYRSYITLGNGKRLFVQEKLQTPPSPACETCRAKRLVLECDANCSLEDLYNLAMAHFSVTEPGESSICMGDASRLVYDSEEFTDNFTKKLKDLAGFYEGGRMLIQTEQQLYFVYVYFMGRYIAFENDCNKKKSTVSQKEN